MRNLFLAAALIAAPASAQDSALVGDYRLAEGPDVAGALRIREDGRFLYWLAAGALDARATGRWEARDGMACLTTEPKPVPPVIEKGPIIAVEGTVPTLLVTWPNGEGVPGVDFVIGFDRGEPLAGYTQYDGWTMPAGDPRVPTWVELSEPIYRITAPRFALAASDGGKLRAIIVPNDLGIVNFDAACAERTETGLILHRAEGDMRFVRDGGE
ncbi:MAG: hypothetical protein ACO1NN_13090 [Sphingopyxis sp.]